MKGFKKKQVKGLTLGEKLQEIRNEKRISLSEIARKTQIPLDYLEKLEKGEYDQLPADVYVKGYLKSCAEYLGVNYKVLLKYYQREKGVQKNIKKTSFKENKISKVKLPKISFFTFKFKYIIILVSLATVIMGGVYLYSELNRFISAPRLIILEPRNGQTVETTEITLKGVTDEGAKILVNQQSVLVGNDGKFEEKLVIKQGENKIIIEAQNRFHKKTVQEIIIYGKFQ